MKRFKRSDKPLHAYPCAGSPLCAAKVAAAGQRCAVHRAWTDGPHDVPCCRCRQPIVRGDLFRRLDEQDPASVAHAPCAGPSRIGAAMRRDFVRALPW